MESVIINGIRYIPEPRKQGEFFVVFKRLGKFDPFVYETRQRLESLPDTQQVRVWCEGGCWQAELV